MESKEIKTQFSSLCQFEGQVSLQDSIRIDGKFSGKVSTPEMLIIGGTGAVDAEVDVGTLAVIGRLKGFVKAHSKIELKPGSDVAADIVTPSLKIENGAVFNGRITMGNRGKNDIVQNENS